MKVNDPTGVYVGMLKEGDRFIFIDKTYRIIKRGKFTESKTPENTADVVSARPDVSSVVFNLTHFDGKTRVKKVIA